MKKEVLKNWYSKEKYAAIKFSEITGKYVTNDHLKLVRDRFEKSFEISEIGKSVDEFPIYKFKIGTGKIKILAWSQMHGNESTTTKAVFDLLKAFQLFPDDELLKSILDTCTLSVIPILNPDGARRYTRVNRNHVDLNRDMQDLTQPESRILKNIFDEIKPDYCLNLHDQRTIFSAGAENESATLSFLTPSRDEERTIDEARKRSMALIAGMAQDLKEDLPKNIGRYDDGFNINCAGDTFQSLSTPTILFEAGHYAEDYEREETRRFVFKALVSCLQQIASGDYGDASKYHEIPENQKLFNDVIIRNASIDNNRVDVAIQFKEMLKDKKIDLVPIVEKIASKIENYGHREIDAKGQSLEIPGKGQIIENVIVDKIILNNEELQVKRQ